MAIQFRDFDMDRSLVAPFIYGEYPRDTTNRGIILPKEITQELKHFLNSFNASVGIEQTPYYRIDAYFDEQSLWILEINASFVDGWGNALNLARASGIAIDPALLVFPKRLATMESVYQPELELFKNELDKRGITDCRICTKDHIGDEPTYVYGRLKSKGPQHILPYDGHRLDNKLNLGLFSRSWESKTVRTPRHFIGRFEPWENIPPDVVLKFCDKDGKECQRARWSVHFKKPLGKSPFLKHCYREETLLAQEIVRPMRDAGRCCQLIILAIGETPITGYIQYLGDMVYNRTGTILINDNSTHGPLQID